ncbi:PREDICTED: putative wall-associated receptor kinase-like 16 [Nelumbo nucifera]|uniref:Wall-associated receptor kinase-like 16 n=2 Tax=Nelumbo nucifera TaxID=4432 RepID=A0A1U7ZQ08_NELNU|nr:PREDICTED: putative wall-associated receptor kinase-like 16 [Nelumbo nucifera]DAD39343.1 TPA_asm: hypothetical protein HUJ06_013666 [Nelumbo nucifera]
MGWSLKLTILLLCVEAAASVTPLTMPGCREYCGDVSIPYPFGVGDSICFKNPYFELYCNESSFYQHPVLFFGKGSNVPILNISLELGLLKVDLLQARDCYDRSGISVDRFNQWFAFAEFFTLSQTRNKFTAIGCDTIAFMTDSAGESFTTGCVSVCNSLDNVTGGVCSGIGCCQTPIPTGFRNVTMSLGSVFNHTNSFDFNPCSYAFLADQEWFNFSRSDLSSTGNRLRTAPAVVEFVVEKKTCEEAGNKCGPNSKCSYSHDGAGYRCHCNLGYQGNPYLPQGCQDTDECGDIHNNPCVKEAQCINTKGNYSCSCRRGYRGDGKVYGIGCIRGTKAFPIMPVVGGTGLSILFLLACGSLLYYTIKKRKLIKLRQKFFQQNGGLLLQQQISSRRGVSDIAKIFSEEDLKKATNNFDESHIIGQGGYGRVYKGILPDKRVVAIKKSKIMDQSQILQFINEVDILSQINHRNVVKLLGCCFETEVPLLVYEFISNGTLYQHLHNEDHASPIPWEKRLRIAAETAGALAYLHSAHSIPVLHRDMKTANILLDDNYIAKVSDFGASRLVPMDQTQMTTLVQGTLGYLDPECFHTGQLTDKSDVYSFGVVLAELLTGEEPLSPERPPEHKSLAMYFLSSIKENRLFEILENEVLNEGNREQLMAVAMLAKRCLKLKGEERPTMKEVAAELEGLRKIQQHPWVQGNQEETEYLLGEPSSYSIDNGNATGQESLGNDFILEIDIAR